MFLMDIFLTNPLSEFKKFRKIFPIFFMAFFDRFFVINWSQKNGLLFWFKNKKNAQKRAFHGVFLGHVFTH